MFSFLKRDAAPDRTVLLAARPRRNELVQESRRTGKSRRLTAPLKPSFMTGFLSKAPSEKSFDLDDLGGWVWDHIDGKATVASLITRFAGEHRLNPREAEVSVLAFLKMLTQRNLIALVAPKSNHEGTKARRKKKK